MKIKFRDKRFPIIFLVLAIVSTLGIFFVSSMSMTITGAAIGSIFSGWTIIWAILILVTIFIGISILHKK